MDDLYLNTIKIKATRQLKMDPTRENLCVGFVEEKDKKRCLKLLNMKGRSDPRTYLVSYRHLKNSDGSNGIRTDDLRDASAML